MLPLESVIPGIPVTLTGIIVTNLIVFRKAMETDLAAIL